MFCVKIVFCFATYDVNCLNVNMDVMSGHANRLLFLNPKPVLVVLMC